MDQRDWIGRDLYREMGVPRDASAREISRAYRRRARALHPDANPGNAMANALFTALSQAYGVLSDRQRRNEYDAIRSAWDREARAEGSVPGAGSMSQPRSPSVTSPRCPSCHGTGVVSREQGFFGFSVPCRDCRGGSRSA